MKYFKSLLKSEKHHGLFIEVILVLFIIFNISVPLNLAKLIDSRIGMFVIVLLGFSLFSISMIGGIIGLLAAYVLVKRSSRIAGNFYYGSEIEPLKMEMLNKYNDTDDKTLEEEMVSKMAPIKQDSTDPASYKPTLNSIEGGFAPINYEGVI